MRDFNNLDQDYQDHHRRRNVKATEALLASLVEHHGAPSIETNAEPIDLVPAVVAPPKPPQTALERWLDTYEPLPKPIYPTVASIKELVAKHFGVTVLEIDSARRTDRIALPRQIGYYLARKLTPRSLPDIGRKFNRDHTSLISGIRKVERLRQTDEKFEADLQALASALGGAL